MNLQMLSLLIVLALLLAAVVSDLQSRRIPNALVLYGMLLGLSFQALVPEGQGLVPGGEGGLPAALLGALTGLALFLPLHALHTLGAGDVKLMAMAGTWLGVDGVAHAALWTLAAGGLLALLFAVTGGHVQRVSRNLIGMVAGTALSVLHRQGTAVLRPAQPTGRLPYALAIAAGCAFELARRWGLT